MPRPVVKRERIEHGVVEVVARKGLPATTILDIAMAAGVSPGLLYRYWRNRDDLAGHVYRAHYERMIAQLRARAAPARGPWDKLSAMIRAFFEFADQNPTVLKFLLRSQHDLHRTLPPEKGVRTLLMDLLRRGMATGQIRPLDPDLAAQIVLGAVVQPAVGALYGDLSGPMIKHHPAVLASLQGALATPAAPGQNVRDATG